MTMTASSRNTATNIVPIAPKGKRPIVFCDFDGTITLSDNIIAIMKHFDPPGWKDMLAELNRGAASIRDVVTRMFALFPSGMKDDIARFVLDTAGIRPGFAELLQWCKRRDVPFYVTSGGIDFFLRPLLAPFDIDDSHIYCNGVDVGGERIRIVWPHPCDEHCSNDCGMCKARIIRKFPADSHFRLLIGDSTTDFEGAKLADFVFARSRLADLCRELALPFGEYETFHDVIRTLETQLVHSVHSHADPEMEEPR